MPDCPKCKDGACTFHAQTATKEKVAKALGWLKCGDCGEFKEDVSEGVCPLDLEVYGRETEATLCLDCDRERGMSI